MLSPPKPILDSPFQSGITDPQWPFEPPTDSGLDQEGRQRYLSERAGRIDPQNFLTVVSADVNVNGNLSLHRLLHDLSKFAVAQITRKPDQNHIPVLRKLPDTWRVTVTIGFGHSLFLSAAGDDRFGIRHLKPRWLRVMPRVTGDIYDPAEAASDLIFVIASDHPYVNVFIARALCQGNWGRPGIKDNRLIIRSLDQGFSRPDRREFLRFDDGIDNLSNARSDELNRFVYVAKEDTDEPAWAVDGSYLVFRKIRQNLPVWEHFTDSQQSEMIGRVKETGLPLSRQRTGPDDMTPVYSDPKDARDGPLTAHIRKVQPRREGADLFGVQDLSRRFLRRGYPYFDGIDRDGSFSNGLLFMAFMRNLRKQFEWPVFGWQTNPDFPIPGAGIDALYGKGILTNIHGGYYFCPAAGKTKDDFVGSSLFARSAKDGISY